MVSLVLTLQRGDSACRSSMIHSLSLCLLFCSISSASWPSCWWHWLSTWRWIACCQQVSWWLMLTLYKLSQIIGCTINSWQEADEQQLALTTRVFRDTAHYTANSEATQLFTLMRYYMCQLCWVNLYLGLRSYAMTESLLLSEKFHVKLPSKRQTNRVGVVH